MENDITRDFVEDDSLEVGLQLSVLSSMNYMATSYWQMN